MQTVNVIQINISYSYLALRVPANFWASRAPGKLFHRPLLRIEFQFQFQFQLQLFRLPKNKFIIMKQQKKKNTLKYIEIHRNTLKIHRITYKYIEIHRNTLIIHRNT